MMNSHLKYKMHLNCILWLFPAHMYSMQHIDGPPGLPGSKSLKSAYSLIL